MIDTIPPELLFDILVEIVAGYIDRAITVPPANERREILQSFNSPVPVPQLQKPDVESMVEDSLAVMNVDIEAELAEVHGIIDDDEQQRWEMQETEERLAENEIVPLLSVSRYLRATTLEILRAALRTETDGNGR
jgi:hypothetical protein